MSFPWEFQRRTVSMLTPSTRAASPIGRSSSGLYGSLRTLVNVGIHTHRVNQRHAVFPLRMLLGISTVRVMTVATTQPRRPPEWTLGERIRKVRRELSMTQEKFASLIGVGDRALASWEIDKRKPEDLIKIARTIEKKTGYPASWILLGESTAPPEPPDDGQWAVWDSNPQPTDYKVATSRRHLIAA